MSGIVLSSATRSSLLAAQDTASLMAQTQSRLATGKKVNSALDNPTNFFTAAGLDSRASDLSNLLDGISNGTQTIQAASTGITSIQKLVDTAKSIANQALSDKSTSTAGTPATAATYTAAVGYAGSGSTPTGTQDFSGVHNATFTVNDGTNTTKITLDAAHLTGAVSDLTKVSAQNAVDAINNQLTTNGGAAGTAAAVKASLTSDGRITFTSTGTGSTAKVNLSSVAGSDVDLGLGIPAGTGSTRTAATAFATQTFTSVAGKLKVTDASGKSTNISLDNTAGGGSLTDTSTAADVVAAINTQLTAGGTTGAQVTASLDSAGKITFTNKQTGAGTAAPTVDTLTGNTADIGFGAAVATGLGVGATGSGNLAVASGTAAIGASTENTNRTSLANQYKAILDQINELAGDASYNGVNLLNDASSTNKLHISFNEKNNGASIDIQGQDATAVGLGLKDAGGATAADGKFQSDADINTALSALNNATTKLRSQASTLGSNLTVVQTRRDFTKNLVNVLQTGSANLTNADLNEEAANSQALTTRQSLAISSLSLANQAQQGVLQLLR